MVTTAFSVFGYWRTCRSASARSPSTRISALTTIESTGRFTKMSVKFIASSARCSAAASVLLRRGVRVVGRLHAVVDADRRAALELDLAAGHHLGALADAAQDRHL